MDKHDSDLPLTDREKFLLSRITYEIAVVLEDLESMHNKISKAKTTAYKLYNVLGREIG